MIEQSLPSERRQTANFNRTDDKFDVVKALEYAESKHNLKLEQNLCMNHGVAAAMELKHQAQQSTNLPLQIAQGARATADQPMQADEMMLLTDRSKQANGNAQVILERSQQRIRDIAELMGGTSQFTTSMNMFNANGGMMPEDDDDEFASDRKQK